MTTKLSVEDSLKVATFVAACDGRVEGFKLGMEIAKSLFIRHIVERQENQAGEVPLPSEGSK
jgi:hypothetical protein